jgi:chromatin remodeling complex protein RSC6
VARDFLGLCLRRFHEAEVDSRAAVHDHADAEQIQHTRPCGEHDHQNETRLEQFPDHWTIFPLETMYNWAISCDAVSGAAHSECAQCATPYLQGEQMAKKAAKKAKTTKKKAAKKPARKANAAFMRPVTPSATLAEVVGATPIPRTEVTKKLWAYIKRKGLQDAKNRRMINADDKLKPIFGGKSQVSMFDMTKMVSKHLK